MANQQSFLKRQKERARQERNRDKMLEKEARKKAKAERGTAPPGEDPDIAGIVPGPQAPLDP